MSLSTFLLALLWPSCWLWPSSASPPSKHATIILLQPHAPAKPVPVPCSAPTLELYSETLCNRSCYTIEGYWVYQSQAKTHWQVCSERIIGTQHLDHAISSDIAFTYSKETKTAEQLAHHRIYDKRDHSSTHI